MKLQVKVLAVVTRLECELKVSNAIFEDMNEHYPDLVNKSINRIKDER